MKKLISVIAALVIALCSFGICAFASDVNEMVPFAYGTVNPSSLNVRSAPSISGTRIAGLKKGEYIFIIGKENVENEDWFKINYKGTAAYVLADQITCFVCISVGKVNAASLNVRSAPNKERIGGVSQNKYVYIVGQVTDNNEVWYMIYYNGQVGYVLADNITFIGDISQLPPMSSKEVSYKASARVTVVANNVPKGYRIKANDTLSSVQDKECDNLSVTLDFSELKNDAEIKVSVIDLNGKEITGLTNTLTLDVKNGFFDKIGSFFKFVFSGFKYPSENIIFD